MANGTAFARKLMDHEATMVDAKRREKSAEVDIGHQEAQEPSQQIVKSVQNHRFSGQEIQEP